MEAPHPPEGLTSVEKLLSLKGQRLPYKLQLSGLESSLKTGTGAHPPPSTRLPVLHLQATQASQGGAGLRLHKVAPTFPGPVTRLGKSRRKWRGHTSGAERLRVKAWFFY